MAADRAQITADRVGAIGESIGGQDCSRELNALTYQITGAAFRVARELGTGFLEKVYENALGIELRSEGLEVEQQPSIPVQYRGEIVGIYHADLIVERQVIVELKVAAALEHSHHAQCVHYLRATRLPACLLLNFGRPHIEHRRFVMTTGLAAQPRID